MTNIYGENVPFRGLRVNGKWYQTTILLTTDGQELIVAQQRLTDVLLNEETLEPVDEDAKKIIDSIFFFAPNKFFGLDGPDDELVRFLNRQVKGKTFLTEEEEIAIREGWR